MAASYVYFSDLCASGDCPASSGNALKIEPVQITFPDTETDSTPATNLSVVLGVIGTPFAASLATAATYKLYVKSAPNASKEGYVVSAGTVPISRVLGDTGGTLVTAVVNAFLIGY